MLRTLCNYSWFRGPIYSKLSHIQNRCLSLLLNVSAIFYNYERFTVSTMGYYPLYGLLFSYSFLPSFLSIYAIYRLLITHSVVDIWQKFVYGLRVKRKEKYLYNRICSNIANNSKKQNSGKWQLVQSYTHLK